MRILTALIAAAALCASLSAQAELTPLPLPLDNPKDMPLQLYVPDTYARSEVQELSPAEAAELFKSTAAPHWHALEVRAPACDSKVNKKNSKECNEIYKQCVSATKIANKYRTGITCSALYKRTTVVVTTVPTPKKGPHPIKSSTRKHQGQLKSRTSSSPDTGNGKRNNCD